MKKTLLILIFFALLIACSNETKCPQFPTQLQKWMPYANNEKAMFISSKEIQTFEFNNVYATPYYTIGGNEACNCEAIAYCNSNVDSVNNIQLTCSADKKAARTEFEYKFHHYAYKGAYYVPTTIDNFAFAIKKDGTLEYANAIDTLVVNKNTYTDVIAVEIDTVSKRSTLIYKVYIANGFGIVKYESKDGISYELKRF